MPNPIRPDVSSTRRPRGLPLQVRAIAPALAAIVTITVGLFSLIVWLHYTRDIHSSWFLQDPAARLNAPFYTGAVSYLGILLWTATATICFITYAVIRQVPARLSMARYLLCAAGLTTFLMLDDLFQLHELVFPKHVGIPENVVYIGYIVVTLLYLHHSRKAILATDYLLKFIALCFFGCSVFLDVLHPPIPLRREWEAATKFAGIACWLMYFMRESIYLLKSHMTLTVTPLVSTKPSLVGKVQAEV